MKEVLNYYKQEFSEQCSVKLYNSCDQLVKGKLLRVYTEHDVSWLPEGCRDEIQRLLRVYLERSMAPNPVEFLISVYKEPVVWGMLNYYRLAYNSILGRTIVYNSEEVLYSFLNGEDSNLRTKFKDVQDAIYSISTPSFQKISKCANGNSLVTVLLGAEMNAHDECVLGFSVTEQVKLHSVLIDYGVNSFNDVYSTAMLLSCREVCQMDQAVCIIEALLLREFDFNKDYSSIGDVLRMNSKGGVISCLTS